MVTWGLGLLLAFAIGAYAGIALMAIMNVASHEVPRPESLPLADGLLSSAVAAAANQVDAVARPKRERRSAVRGPTKRRPPDPLEAQAHFQW